MFWQVTQQLLEGFESTLKLFCITLVAALPLGLIISFIPALHEVANFSWFIGVFLGATLYRWLARDEREVQATAAFHSGAVAQKE